MKTEKMTEKEALFEYWLRIGDSSLIAGHRLSEWCGKGPILEEDIAMTNIALDLVGQARIALQSAAEASDKKQTEDDLAYKRDVREYRNLLLCEQPNGDYGQTIARNFLFAAFNYHFLTALKESKNEALAAYAEKSLKEVTYHLRHSSDWVIRLGDGTEESHQRIQEPINDLWMFTGEFFQMDEVDKLLMEAGVAPDLTMLKAKWDTTVSQVLAEATLQKPEDGWMQKGGKQGKHSEHLGYLLAEMQFLPRAYPNAAW